MNQNSEQQDNLSLDELVKGATGYTRAYLFVKDGEEAVVFHSPKDEDAFLQEQVERGWALVERRVLREGE